MQFVMDDKKGKKQLGQGAHGIVYEGVLGSHSRQRVAIKEIKDFSLDGSLGSDDRDAIFKEIRTLAHLQQFRHKEEDAGRVVGFVGYCTQPFQLIMELMGRGTLSKYIHSSEKPIWPALETSWARGVARGMAFLHRHGVVHRDLKPTNVLLSDRLQPAIADFGISKVTAVTQRSSGGAKAGTVHYKAPETFRLNPKWSAAADVYSYSILVWELSERQHPYGDADVSDIKDGVKGGERPDLSKPSKRLNALMAKCWAQAPADRPCFAEVIAQLDELAPPLQTSGFGKAYDAAEPFGTVEEAWDGVYAFLTELAKTEGIMPSKVDVPFRGLKKSVTDGALKNKWELTPALVCLLAWTSTNRVEILGEHEFCFFINHALRLDHSVGRGVLDPCARFCRTLNKEYLVNRTRVGDEKDWPKNLRSFRGAGIPEDELAQFREFGVRYRVPFMLATSQAEDTAKSFARRGAQDGRVPVIFEIAFNEQPRVLPLCDHVCLIPRTLVLGEKEFLFVAQSVFTILRGPVKEGGFTRIIVQAARDNSVEDDDLPRATWH